MKRNSILSLLVFAMLSAMSYTSSALANDDASKLVDETTVAIKAAIKKERDVLAKDRNRLMELVDKIVLPHFDFAKMSNWALGKYWNEASKDQQSKFASEFRKLLVRTYAVALLDNVDRKISIVSSEVNKKSDKKVMVKTEVEQDGGFPIPIDYKMHMVGAEWKVYDVVIDGISLVSNYRTSFANEIKKSGIESVIASLKQRNDSATN